MKFLHAADIHLDSPLQGLARHATIPAHVTQGCTRRALAKLVDLAIAEDVAFVVIAGDVFDGDWKDFSTGLFFAAQMRRLSRPCILVRGNHDAASVITRGLVPPPNVHAFSAKRPETHILPELEVALHGQSFPNRAVPEDLSAAYPVPVAGLLNIGVLHSSAENPGEHATYAPCSVRALALKGYDYWALGHIHQRVVLHERPWIVFPGNIQGRNPRETGAKGCTLVTVQDRRIVGVDHRDTDVLRWAQAGVPADGCDNLAEVADRVRATLARLHVEASDLPLLVRLTLEGATDAHAAMLADPDALDAECRNAAVAISDDIHIDRVRLLTRPGGDRPGQAEEAAAQLAAPFQDALDDPAVQAQLLDELRALAKQIPDALRPALPQTIEDLRALLPDAWAMVAHRLGDPGRAA